MERRQGEGGVKGRKEEKRENRGEDLRQQMEHNCAKQSVCGGMGGGGVVTATVTALLTQKDGE